MPGQPPAGGLLNAAAAFMFAHGMPTSVPLPGLGAIRMVRRLIEVVAARSRPVHVGPGYRGWLVSGAHATELQPSLESVDSLIGD
ncbi:hypothetical protein CTA1_1844 [Colletotrichum tanaceti]|uniref:Uncharacterized protein n=1 Tax=Colletotrichum tanaceti TaxID=1306861 RepID=A0A4U6XBP8_9PEZI|nr:hypothetical protein CTA1_1844 [Colletotrichum tanaceti]